LQDGNYRVLGYPERPGVLPIVTGDGKWAVISGTGHSGNPDLDLMADNLERSPKLGLRGRAVLPNGNEHHPAFSPDDKWLYFVTTKKDKDQVINVLRRIDAAVVLTKDLHPLDEKQIETIIPQLPGEVERLSIFPNGQKLLAQTDKGILVIEIATKKLIPIVPKNLKDAELNVPIEAIRDGWAGPTDDRVTFSGKTTDKDGKVRRRIYSCRFDGSDLKAHTPRDNEPVPMYKFPGSDKTAYDIAKEWALNEIKWDDEHRSSR
jgi:Tol biopolymer transport system component